MITEDAVFTVAPKRRRTPVIAELLLRPAGAPLRYRRHPRFRYLRTLTRVGGPPPTGRIPAILGGWFPDLSGWRVYIAGAPGFVTACAAAARACGARPGRVVSGGSSPPVRTRHTGHWPMSTGRLVPVEVGQAAHGHSSTMTPPLA